MFGIRVVDLKLAGKLLIFWLICGCNIYATNLEREWRLGQEYYQAGQHRKATQQFQKLADQSAHFTKKQQAQVYFNLACCHAQQEAWELALKCFEQVVAVDPEHKRALQNIKIIKELLDQKQHQKQPEQDQLNPAEQKYLQAVQKMDQQVQEYNRRQVQMARANQADEQKNEW